MATFTANANQAVNFDQLDFRTFLSTSFGDDVTRTPTLQRIVIGNTVKELIGTDFTFDNFGRPNGGTITEIREIRDGQTIFTIEGLSLDAAVFSFEATGLESGRPLVFGGNDSIGGSAQSDTLEGFDGDDSLRGFVGDDQLRGDSGNDTLDGGIGADLMTGNDGSDVYFVDSAGDTVIDDGVGGIDTVFSSISLTMPSGVENLTLTGTAALSGTGDEAANVIQGNNAANLLAGLGGNDTLVGLGGNDTLDGGDADDSLDGGTGADSLSGGSGGDTYIVDNLGDKIVDVAGIDRVESFLSFVLAPDLEHLTLVGTAAINGTGNESDNVIVGNDAANVIDGKVGADTMQGGKGNDTYFVDNIGDVVASEDEGVDTVKSSVSFSLEGTQVENLELLGSDNLQGFGNARSNRITGNKGDNLLDGGNGRDTLVGGAGNDIYFLLDAGDVVVEAANAGTDVVASVFDYTLGTNVENLNLIGNGNASGTGNAAANRIEGNIGNNKLIGLDGADTLVGGDGNDILAGGNGADELFGGNNNDQLDGGTGNDTLDGGDGADRAIGGAGNDVVHGLTGDDTLLGGDGSDELHGGADNDQLDGGSGNDRLEGEEGADVVLGGSGNDTLNGGIGADTMTGGVGNDLYIVDDAGDVVTEAANGGIDAVSAFVNHTLAANVENLVLVGFDDIDGTGNSVNNTITGNRGNNRLEGLGGNDTLQGFAGADTLAGGSGNDTYLLLTGDEVIVELAGEGTDTVRSVIFPVTILAENVENLILDENGGTIDGTGNTLANVITGNDRSNDLRGLEGNDTLLGGGGGDFLNGGTGDDSMVGGTGDDIYFVDGADDKVIESANSGFDKVISLVSLTLAANVELLELGGNEAINGTGNALANEIEGNSGANIISGAGGSDTLFGANGDDKLDGGDGNDSLNGGVNNDSLAGGAGNDTLNGSSGVDTMSGGSGNDIYLVDNAADVVVEAANQGTDLVESSAAAYTLGANVEDLLLSFSSAAAVNGTGNTLNNRITGNNNANRLEGAAGNDTLNGGLGNDTLAGGTGNDIYFFFNDTDTVLENAGEGIDTIESRFSVTLAENVENLKLSEFDLTGTGNALANVIVVTAGGGNNRLLGLGGNDTLIGTGGRDTLDGGAGADSMIGGGNDDVYVVDDIADKVVEAANAGVDLIQTTISLTLAANVEDLLLLGAAAINGTGNALGNDITGNGAANKLDGAAGNDTLDGGLGSDTLIGGVGNDVYIVDNLGDVVIEAANQGIDTVISKLASFTLGANFENLFLAGSALDGIGNDLNNEITGSDIANLLAGSAGNDTLNGGVGNDTLLGGAGNDTYVLFNDVDNVVEDTGEGIDTIESRFSVTLAENVENLKLIELGLTGTGNVLANVITVTAGDNKLLGLGGNDTLIGAAGRDTLDGGAGADSMIGGGRDDIYIVDNVGDRVVEAANGGTDAIHASISLTLAANVENLLLLGTEAISGTGNTLGNELTGNGAANRLDGAAGNDNLDGGLGNDTLIGGSGNDTLNGNAGSDSMAGGIGNDTYLVESAGDVVSEASNQGVDTVLAVIDHVLAANVENLTLSGVAINGTGNADANLITGNGKANTLTGLAGNDTLDGGGKDSVVDTLIGGLGNDTYVLFFGFDGKTDQIIENAGEGIDTIESDDSLQLNLVSPNVENLKLVGSGNLVGVGNALANVITGNDGNNALAGLAGNDTLNGGAGGDTLNGGSGNDSMAGGAGDDLHVVEDAGDKVIESVNGGFDRVESLVSFTLGANVEDLTLVGFDAINGTGNGLANEIDGNSAANLLNGGGGNDLLEGGGGNDTLIGGSGNDILTGNAGADTMVGGAGNDIYDVDDVGDIVSEAGGSGIDQVNTTVSFTLGAGIENLLLVGANLVGTGNSLANLISADEAGGDNFLAGAAGNDTLLGGDGSDTLTGGAGNDLLRGDNGSDVFLRLSAQDGKDTILDFELGAAGDVLDIADVLVGFDAGDDANAFVQLVESGGSTTVRIDANGAVGGANFVDAVVLTGVTGVTVETLVNDGNLVLS
jgi:Ca2+-binding RTX toxin-like protein